MKKLVEVKALFPSGDGDSLTKAIDFIEASLSEIGYSKKEIMKSLLLAEEIIHSFISQAEPSGNLQVKVRRLIGPAEIIINLSGMEADPYLGYMPDYANSEEAGDEDTQNAIRSILLKSQSDKIKFTYKNGVNRARIKVGGFEQATLVNTVIAAVIGLIVGTLMTWVFPKGVSDGLSKYLLNPGKTMFMNALKIVIAPVVFFSIATCISQFSDVRELGKIGAKVMVMYLFTTVVAVIISTAMSLTIQPGEWGFALSMDQMAQVSVDSEMDTSLLSTIVNIIPSNFVEPFVKADTLQLIFLGLLTGIAAGAVERYSEEIKVFLEAGNALFLKITTMIAKFIPIVVLCSVALMLRDLGGTSFLYVLGYFGVIALTAAVMLCFYGLLILILARLNPLTFYKKNREGMVTSLTLSSSNAAMPTNMKTCVNKLGISPKVCGFSIPLGATINMDGTCEFLMIVTFFLARAYGITIEPSQIISLAVVVILLSLGAPGVPGCGLICCGVALASVGVPIEGMGIIIAIHPLIDMINTMCNTTGDVACATIVAKSEKLLDEKIFNDPEKS